MQFLGYETALFPLVLFQRAVMVPWRINLIIFFIFFLCGGQFGMARRVNTGVTLLDTSSCETERAALRSGSNWSKSPFHMT